MIRTLLSVPILVMTVMPLSSDGNCDHAYFAFVDHLNGLSVAMEGERLARIHRSALRTFDACDSGHVQKPEIMFRDLEREIVGGL
jgi:hypothetical protein